MPKKCLRRLEYFEATIDFLLHIGNLEVGCGQLSLYLYQRLYLDSRFVSKLCDCVRMIYMCGTNMMIDFYFISCRHNSFSVTSGISEKGPQGRENRKEINFVGLLLLISISFFSSLSVALLRDAPSGFFFLHSFSFSIISICSLVLIFSFPPLWWRVMGFL